MRRGKGVTIDFSYASGIKHFSSNIVDKVNVKNVILPAGLESIGAGAFKHKNYLEGVDFSRVKLLKDIPLDLFQRSSYLNEISIPECVEVIGNNAFESCIRLKDVKFSSSGKLREIGDYAFKDCGLLDLILPDKLEKISVGAFENNRLLKTVKIPRKVSSISDGAFKGVGEKSTFLVFRGSYGEQYCNKEGLNHETFNNDNDMECGLKRHTEDSDNTMQKLQILDADMYNLFINLNIDKRDAKIYYSIINKVKTRLEDVSSIKVNDRLFKDNKYNKDAVGAINRCNFYKNYGSGQQEEVVTNRICNLYLEFSLDVSKHANESKIADAIYGIRNELTWSTIVNSMQGDKYNLNTYRLNFNDQDLVVIYTNSDIKYVGIKNRLSRGSLGLQGADGGVEFILKEGDVSISNPGYYVVNGIKIEFDMLKRISERLKYSFKAETVYMSDEHNSLMEYAYKSGKIITTSKVGSGAYKIGSIKDLGELNAEEKEKISSKLITADTHKALKTFIKKGLKMSK